MRTLHETCGRPDVTSTIDNGKVFLLLCLNFRRRGLLHGFLYGRVDFVLIVGLDEVAVFGRINEFVVAVAILCEHTIEGIDFINIVRGITDSLGNVRNDVVLRALLGFFGLLLGVLCVLLGFLCRLFGRVVVHDFIHGLVALGLNLVHVVLNFLRGLVQFTIELPVVAGNLPGNCARCAAGYGAAVVGEVYITTIRRCYGVRKFIKPFKAVLFPLLYKPVTGVRILFQEVVRKVKGMAFVVIRRTVAVAFQGRDQQAVPVLLIEVTSQQVHFRHGVRIHPVYLWIHSIA